MRQRVLYRLRRRDQTWVDSHRNRLLQTRVGRRSCPSPGLVLHCSVDAREKQWGAALACVGSWATSHSYVRLALQKEAASPLRAHHLLPPKLTPQADCAPASRGALAACSHATVNLFKGDLSSASRAC